MDYLSTQCHSSQNCHISPRAACYNGRMENEQPSVTGSFFRGLLSGAVSGLLMVGILAALGPAFTAIAPALHLGALHFGVDLAYGAFMVAVTSLFGGIMSAAKTFMHSGSAGYSPARTSESPEIIPVIAPSVSPDLAPAVAPVPSLDAAPESAPAPAQSWVDRTGGTGEAQNRIQEILNNRALNDKSRAEALLAARNQAAAENKALA